MPQFKFKFWFLDAQTDDRIILIKLRTEIVSARLLISAVVYFVQTILGSKHRLVVQPAVYLKLSSKKLPFSITRLLCAQSYVAVTFLLPNYYYYIK